MLKRISTKEVYSKLKNSQIKILDVRPVDAYNGWQLKGETRSGHIKGANSLPAAWTKYMDWIEIVRSKGITPDTSLTIYGYDEEDTELVAAHLQKTGHKDISIYYDFVDEWCKDADLPMENLPRYQQLVPASWLKDLIDGKKPPHLNSRKYVICHTHYRNRDAYLSGHVPQAIDLNTLDLESHDTWDRHSPEEIRETLLKHGITADTTVILYGKFLFPKNEDPFPGSAAGHLGAMRCAFIMMYAGVKDVKVLNGGYQSWVDAGYDISEEDVPEKPETEFGIDIPANPELAVDLPEAKELLKSPDGDLICVRSWPEYIGEVSGYNYIDKKGRIPGAVFSDCGSDAYHMENYCNLDHTTREFREIEKNLLDSGVKRENHNAFYCGTGWRGSEAFFNAYLMGWPKVSVFDGGWFAWSNDESNPVETGYPK